MLALSTFGDAMPAYHHGNLRKALMERAVEIIGTDGVDAVSLRGLARDLDVSHAAPSRHFASRADLLKAIAVEDAGAMVDAVRDAIGKAEDDPFARLSAAAQAYVDWVLRYPAHFRAARNPEVSRHAVDDLARTIGTLADLLRETITDAQSQGWRREVPLEVVLFQFVATLVGAATLITDPIYQAIERSGGDRAKLFDEMLERLLS